ARYNYYKHGPLARTVLGHQQVQGVDYAYTLQGWLKGVNSSNLNDTNDMGHDGHGAAKMVARDAYGFSLNYFSNDYTPIYSGANVFGGDSWYDALKDINVVHPLYNGNISSMAVNIGKFNDPRLYNYKYDQLNRITAMDSYQGLNTTFNAWLSLTNHDEYKERI